MAQTTTAAQVKSDAKQKSRAPKVRELEVGRAGQHILDQLANARSERLQSERKEKPLKQKLRELWLEKALKMKHGDQLVIKAQGVVRGTVTWKGFGKKTVDLDLLLTAFPEAYAACVKDADPYLQFDPS